MIDSLGGILTNGLLGSGPSSMILGQFNLSLFGITVIVTPVKGHPQTWGGSPPVRDYGQEDDRYITIRLKLKENEYVRNYRISNNKATVLIKLNETIKTVIQKSEVFVNKFIIKPIKRVFNIKIK